MDSRQSFILIIQFYDKQLQFITYINPSIYIYQESTLLLITIYKVKYYIFNAKYDYKTIIKRSVELPIEDTKSINILNTWKFRKSEQTYSRAQ